MTQKDQAEDDTRGPRQLKKKRKKEESYVQLVGQGRHVRPKGGQRRRAKHTKKTHKSHKKKTN